MSGVQVTPTFNSKGANQPQFHPTLRRKVTAVVEAQLFQVGIVDTQGKIGVMFLYRCGPNCFLASSMDGLFDIDRRRACPKWVIEQLDSGEVPLEDFRGRKVSRSTSRKSSKSLIETATVHVPENTELPEVVFEE